MSSCCSVVIAVLITTVGTFCVEEEHEQTRPLITPGDEHRPAQSDVPQHQQLEDVGRGDSAASTNEASSGLSPEYLDQVRQKLRELCPQRPREVLDYQRALFDYQRSLFA